MQIALVRACYLDEKCIILSFLYKLYLMYSCVKSENSGNQFVCSAYAPPGDVNFLVLVYILISIIQRKIETNMGSVSNEECGYASSC
jgi:hypothetical protein